jgi:protein-disulfide isomerase
LAAERLEVERLKTERDTQVVTAMEGDRIEAEADTRTASKAERQGGRTRATGGTTPSGQIAETEHAAHPALQVINEKAPVAAPNPTKRAKFGGKSVLIALTACIGFGLLLALCRSSRVPEPEPEPKLEAVAATPPSLPEQRSAAVPVNDSDPQLGPANALVTIVEFSELQCPFCERVVPTIRRIGEEYASKVRVVFKHSPLPFHERARSAAEAASTVFSLAGSAAFFRFCEQAMANQRALTDENYALWAGEVGVQSGQFSAAYGAKQFAAKVDEDMALAKKLGVKGVPAFFINGAALSGAQPFEKFKTVIDRELAEAEKLSSKGMAAADIYLSRTNQNQLATGATPQESEKPSP